MNPELQIHKQAVPANVQTPPPPAPPQGDLDDFIFQDETIKYHSER